MCSHAAQPHDGKNVAGINEKGSCYTVQTDKTDDILDCTIQSQTCKLFTHLEIGQLVDSARDDSARDDNIRGSYS